MSDFGDDDSLDEDPLESDQDPSDTLDVIYCPQCGQPIIDTAEICPRCGNYILSEDLPGERRPTWWILVVLMLMLGLIGFALWR